MKPHEPENTDKKQEALEAFTKAFQKLAAEVTRTANSVLDYIPSSPPKNIPHDPSLRKDRRKWGGR